jgi:hypothetical protein
MNTGKTVEKKRERNILVCIKQGGIVMQFVKIFLKKHQAVSQRNKS